MSFYIVKGDIFKQQVDAIVLTTSAKLKLEGKLGEQAYEKCGDRLVCELDQTKGPSLSQCVITNAYNLPCKRIIHVATPRWNGGDNNEEAYLKQCYINCLDMLRSFKLKSIVFPLLSAGAYHFPYNKAITIAIETLEKYAKKYEELDIGLIIYEAHIWNSYKSLLNKYAIEGGELSEETKEHLESVKREQRGFSKWYKAGEEEILDGGTEAQELSQRLLYLIKTKGKTQQQCYTGVISKTAFDKIIKGTVPSKYTLVALGVNIGLDYYEINELLAPIGERLDEFLDKDQIIVLGIHKYKDEEGVNRLAAINEELVSVGCIPLKTN